MRRLEVSGAVRPIYASLSFKGLKIRHEITISAFRNLFVNTFRLADEKYFDHTEKMIVSTTTKKNHTIK